MSETPATQVEEPRVERLPPRGAPIEGLSPGKRRTALAIALVADVIQWVLAPLVLWGVASPLDDVLDVVVAFLLIRLIGFHWALAPAFVAKIVPFVDLVPTWTAAVWLATRGRKDAGH
jgi:hypothetical protein